MFHAEKDTHEEEDMERQKRQGAEYEFYGKLPLKKGNPAGITACAGNVCGKPDTDPDHLRGMWYCR